MPNLKTWSIGAKIANKNPMSGKITICDNRPISKAFKFLKTSKKLLMLTLMPTPIMIRKSASGDKSKIIFSTTASSIEEIEDKIKSIENSKFNLEESQKIMSSYAVFK